MEIIRQQRPGGYFELKNRKKPPVPLGPYDGFETRSQRAKHNWRKLAGGVISGLRANRVTNFPRPAGASQDKDFTSMNTTFYDYADDQVAEHFIDDETDDFDEVSEFFEKHPSPGWAHCRWISCFGNSSRTMESLRQLYNLHPLAVEDALQIPQRSKVDHYPGHIFFVIRAVMLQTKKGAKAITPDVIASPPPEAVKKLRFTTEQISIFLLNNTIITLQERQSRTCDVFAPVRKKLLESSSKLRAKDCSFLMYMLLDCIIKRYFPLLMLYGDLVENIEMKMLENATPELMSRTQGVRRELMMLRRVLWPMREVSLSLQHPDGEVLITSESRAYLRDVHDHIVQNVEILETYLEMCNAIADIYKTAQENQTNEMMRVLTAISTIFIPITFLAGVWGMNFHHMPELRWKHGYHLFWLICIVLTAFQIWLFRKRKWL